MTEGGRSIVWAAVQEVLKRWSDRGKIGTNSRYRKPDPRPWELGEGEPFERDSIASFREALMDGAKPKDRFYRLHQDEIDDIASEISQAIETRLERISEDDKGQKKQYEKPSWMKLLSGGKENKDAKEEKENDRGGRAHPLKVAPGEVSPPRVGSDPSSVKRDRDMSQEDG